MVVATENLSDSVSDDRAGPGPGPWVELFNVDSTKVAGMLMLRPPGVCLTTLKGALIFRSELASIGAMLFSLGILL